MTAPALYRTRIQHVRQSPFRHAFTYRSRWWLVDLDALPRLGPWARFRSSDHVGDPTASIRANVDQLLAGEGLQAHRVLMLANARSLGHVFNPISVHWCFDRSDDVVAVVAEVHNTYGGRHAYVLRPDGDGRARTDKVFYVSPFHDIEGRYEMCLPVPGAELAVDLTYHRDGGKPFVATVRGARTPVTRRAVLGAAAASQIVALRIRIQGIRLFLRRLPVVPRPVVVSARTNLKEHAS